MDSIEHEDLSYRWSFDLLLRFLNLLERFHATSQSGKILECYLDLFAQACTSTLGCNVTVLLWKDGPNGQIIAQAASFDSDLGPAIEWIPSSVGSLRGRAPESYLVRDDSRPLLASGFHFSDGISFSGELWIVVGALDDNVRTFLRFKGAFYAIRIILRIAVERALAYRLLNIAPRLFNENETQGHGFLSEQALSGIRSLDLKQCPPSMDPVIDDILTTFVQVSLLVDFEGSWPQSRLDLGRLGSVSPLSGLSEDLVKSLQHHPEYSAKINILHALDGKKPINPDSLSAAGPSPTYELKREAQEWLAEWTGMLKSSREGSFDRSREPDPFSDSRWEPCLPSMMAACGRFLASWSLPNEKRNEPGNPGGENSSWEPRYLGASFVTPWLRLWFCHELLRLELTDSEFRRRKQSHVRRTRFRRSLVYLLRETVRFFLFWWRADYRFRPRLVARELRRLVVHHAERSLGIDGSLDLMELLQRIERSGDAGAREVASGHLQHVFEVYIAGQFLGSLKVDAPEEKKDLWSLWTRRPETPADLEKLSLRRAFAVAALLHDFGSLLFPSWGREVGGVRSLVQVAEGELDRLSTDLQNAGRRLGETALNALREHEGLLSEQEWDAVERWQAARFDHLGEPEPAVIGAWYVRGLMQQAKLGIDLQRHVLRAMILDRITTLPIDLEADPVAALLVVCDSLFSWEPCPPRRDELVIGRSFSSLQASGRSVAARYDSMHIPGLRFGTRMTDVAGSPSRSILTFCAWMERDSKDSSRDHLPTLPWGLPSFHLQSGSSERSDLEACLDLWLDLSISLGRIGNRLDEPDSFPKPAPLPWVRITTQRPVDLEAAGLSIEDLVGEAAQRSTAALRRALERWLARYEEDLVGQQSPMPSVTTSGAEQEAEAIRPVVFELNPRGKPFAEQDPRPWLEEVQRQSERVIFQRLAQKR